MTVAGPAPRLASAAPTFQTVDLLGPTLRVIDDQLERVAGEPGQLRGAALVWQRTADELRTGVAPVLDTAAREVTDGGLTGTVGEAFVQTDSRVDTWIADGVRRQSGTARTLTAAADLLEQTAGRLTWTKLEFIRRGVQAVNLELTRPSVDVMVRAAAAVVPHSQWALQESERVVADHVSAMVKLAAELREQSVCRDAEGASHQFDVSLFGVPLFPRSWLPSWQLKSLSDYWGMIWPEDPTRRNLALSAGALNVVAETKRISLTYALMTAPTGVFRNILTDTAEPVFDTFDTPIANGAAHAAWGIGGTYFSDWAAGKATQRWGEDIGSWLQKRQLIPPGESFSFHTGATKYIAGVNGVAAFALTVKDPMFVEAGLSSVDAGGHVRPNGALGEAASLAFDVGVVAGPAAAGLGLERWQAEELSRLSAEERMQHVKRTACADWFVGQGGVFLGRAVDDHYTPMARAGFVTASASSMAAAAYWCGSGDAGPGGPPSAGGSPALPAPAPQLTHEDSQLVRQWHAWSHDPELSQSYAQSPEYRQQALVGDAAAELGLVGAVVLGEGAGTGIATIGRAVGPVWESLGGAAASAAVAAH